MKGEVMNKRGLLMAFWIGLICGMILLAGVKLCFAGEKEELQWKAKALVAEYQLRQAQFQQANDALNAFIRELDQKGLAYQDGKIIEKLKPKEPPKKEK